MNKELWIYLILMLMFIAVLVMLGVSIYKCRRGQIRMREMFLLIIVPVYQLILMGFFFAACQSDALSVISFGVMILIFGVGIDVMMLQSLEQMEQKRCLEEKLSRLYEQRQLEMDYYRLNHQNAEKMKQVKAHLLAQIEEAEKILEEKRDMHMVRKVLEACDRIEGGYPPKWISVKADVRSGCLVLQVRNANAMEWDGKSKFPETSKKQKEEHGLGLKLVERTALKYNGKLYMDFGRNMVTVDVILNGALQEQFSSSKNLQFCQVKGM